MIIDLVNVVFEVYTVVLFIRIVLSWIRHNPQQPVIRFIYETTEPFLGLFKRIIPPLGAIDISPIAAFFALSIIRQVVVYLLNLLRIY